MAGGARGGRVLTRRRLALVALLGVAAALVIGRVAAGVYVEYAWYAALGATAVWTTRATALTLMRGVSVIAVSGFAFANLYAVRRSIITVVLPRRMGDLEIGEEVPGRYLDLAVVGGAIALGLVLGLPQHGWTQLVLARAGVPFGEHEQYFDAELGFFVYQLPLEAAIYVRAVTTLLVVLAVVVCLYFLFTPGLRWERNGLRMSAYVRRHLACLALAVYWAAAWSYRLDMYGTLTGGSGPTGAFSYADHKVIIPLNLVMGIVVAGAGVAVMLVLWKGQGRTALVITSLAVLVHLVAFKVAPGLANEFADARNPAVREAHYLAIRALYSRQAYGADALHDATSGVALASPADLGRAVSVWDPAALTVAVERSGGRRSAIVDSGVEWSTATGTLAAIAIARLSPPLAGQSDQAVGVRVSGTATDDRGGIVRIDAQGRPDAPDIPLTPLLVRPGAPDAVIIADSAGRLAAPSVDSFLSRLAHAWAAQNFRLLGEELPGPNPRLVSKRDVRTRIDALVPFFVQGSTVWPAVVGDTAFWLVDLYAASNDYPLSEHLLLGGADRTYFRHAATAVVNASTGGVTLVRDAVLDPIAATWVAQFPGLFVRTDRLAPALLAALPPRVDGALATALAFSRHADAPADSAAPVRAVVLDAADSILATGAVPCIVLAGTDGACAWTIPLVDLHDRVAGLVVAVGGPTPSVFWYRASRPGRPWPGVQEQLEHPSDTAGGSGLGVHLVRGRVRAVPVAGGITFVQSQFAWGIDAPPTLARVTVVAPDRTGTGRSIAEAGGLVSTAVRAPEIAATPAEFRDRVSALYDRMEAALHRSDLTAFGAAFAELGRALGRPKP